MYFTPSSATGPSMLDRLLNQVFHVILVEFQVISDVCYQILNVSSESNKWGQ